MEHDKTGRGGGREREEPICIDMKHSKIYLISNKSMCMTVNFHLQKKKRKNQFIFNLLTCALKYFQQVTHKPSNRNFLGGNLLRAEVRENIHCKFYLTFLTLNHMNVLLTEKVK